MMAADEYLYELATQCADVRGHVAGLRDDELRMLAARARVLQGMNGKPGGIPGLVEGVCDLEAAGRFYRGKAEN